jgi:hypothetical protein
MKKIMLIVKSYQKEKKHLIKQLKALEKVIIKVFF